MSTKVKKKGFKAYVEAITADEQTDVGLFTVQKVDGKYYFEIPFTMLEAEILVVSRISGHVKGLNFGGAGMKSRPQQVIRWQRMDDQVVLRSVSYNDVANFEDPVYRSVKNNNFEPVVEVFPIAAYNPDSTAVVFEVNSLFTTDIPMIGALRADERERETTVLQERRRQPREAAPEARHVQRQHEKQDETRAEKRPADEVPYRPGLGAHPRILRRHRPTRHQ